MWQNFAFEWIALYGPCSWSQDCVGFWLSTAEYIESLVEEMKTKDKNYFLFIKTSEKS